MPFEYRGDIAHADIAFDAWAPTLEELFNEAARATMQVMVENLGEVRPAQTLEVKLEEENEEMLLFDFLNELIFYKDARRLLLLPTEVSVAPADGGFVLRARLSGEEIDVVRHQMNTDVKAVTMLRYKLEQVANGWRATVVLDV
ncbi:archease [Geomonas ferrireducens]|uniref:archease n=1 Tax=Geomonas ferrireducens TaxID=2570227 RepID=UPI0010A768CC|nr:archease [Geomonas ferrireducens]